MNNQTSQSHAHFQDVLHSIDRRVVIQQLSLISESRSVTGSEKCIWVCFVGPLYLYDVLERGTRDGSV